MKANIEKHTILYGRLSQEDDREGESNSISNQRMILEKYAEDKDFENIKFLFDDGYSGTSYNRPAWNEIVAMMEQGQIATIIVKDMSRLGRDYLQTGNLLEHTFPNYNVRFISVSDNVDSLYGIDDFIPFKSLFDDYYAKECSKKQRTVRRVIAERGDRVGTIPPYGYKKDLDNPKRLVVDEEAAEIVKYIFKLCTEGRGPCQIARKLTEDRILNPSNYRYQKTGVGFTNLDTTRPYRWRDNTIVNILNDESYLGHTVSLKHTTASYKNKKQIVRPENEWIRFVNTHENIVEQEIWDIAQQMRQSKKRSLKAMETPNPYSGLVFCADCGKMLNLHRAHTMEESKNNFMCSTYKRYGKEECSSHYLRQCQLDKIILDDIRRVTHFARQDEALFAQFINEKNTAQTRKEITRLQKELDAMRKRDTELTSLFKRLYEDNVLGRIPDEHYRTLSEEYTDEQKALRINIPKAEEQMGKLKNSLTNVDRFIEKAKKYTDLTELTPEILHLFIEKIVVGEKAEKYSRTAPQDIWIHYRDIGMLNDVKAEFDIISLDEINAAGSEIVWDDGLPQAI